MSTVYILGGGVAGLSAAHELVDRGFSVVLFERHAICGGKARSMKYSAPGRNDLPGEHGFRFFPGFYWHLSDTLRRIPLAGGGTAFSNLQVASEIGISQRDKPLFVITAKRPKTLQQWVAALREIVENPALGISLTEARFFVRRILCFVGSGRRRRIADYEGTSWWHFIEAEDKSPQYQAVLGRGLSQSLVAMRPDKASALTIGTMLVQILFKIIEGSEADRILNAPTNEAWIDPWVADLVNRGAQIRRGHTITQINHDPVANRIDSVVVRDDTTGLTATFGTPGDFFLCALPLEVLQNQRQSLFPTSLKRAAGLCRPPPIGVKDDGVDSLETEWMSGVLFYMNRDVSSVNGHVIHCHSSWALTSVSQRQFWRPDYPWHLQGNGHVRDVLSTIISDWTQPGTEGVPTPAKMSTRQQIVDESWAQLKRHLSMAGNGTLTDGDRVDAFIDPAILFDAADRVVANDEPLLVNTVGSRRHRPPAATLVGNFFVASDYVLTETDLACMEAANEAARHAVNGLLIAAGSTLPPCQIRKLTEPPLFEKFQEIDDEEYQSDPSKPPWLCRLAELLNPDVDVAPFHIKAAIIALLVLAGVNTLLILALLYLVFPS